MKERLLPCSMYPLSTSSMYCITRQLARLKLTSWFNISQDVWGIFMIGYVTSPLFKTTKLLWQTVNSCIQNLKKLNHRKQMNPLSTSLTWQFIKVHSSGIVLVPTSAIAILCYSWFTRSALDTGWSSTSGFLKSCWGLCCISLLVLSLWSSLAEETTIPLVEFTIYHFPKILVCDACLQE